MSDRLEVQVWAVVGAWVGGIFRTQPFESGLQVGSPRGWIAPTYGTDIMTCNTLAGVPGTMTQEGQAIICWPNTFLY